MNAIGRAIADLRAYHLLIGCWVLAMIAIPIARWVIGDAALQWGVVATVLLHTAAVIAVLVDGWGGRATLRTAAIVVALAWLVEFIGSSTGIPFGQYHYTDALRPQLARVPLLIPLAWLMMLPPAWAIAASITGSVRSVSFIALSALAFSAWDLFLDPQMVAWGLWIWDEPGGYFGIPWVNFAGWAISAAAITAIVKPQNLPMRPLLLIYAITWLLQTIGLLIFWGMPGPALAGFFAMGLFVVLALRASAGHAGRRGMLAQTRIHTGS